MTILQDLPVVGLQTFEIISKIIHLEVQIRDFWNNFKNMDSKSWIFETISKIWSPNPGFLKYFENLEVQIIDV